MPMDVVRQWGVRVVRRGGDLLRGCSLGIAATGRCGHGGGCDAGNERVCVRVCVRVHASG